MIATLLALALQLLVAAQQPNVPTELKNRAISVAILAIKESEPIKAEVQRVPLFGSIAASNTPAVAPIKETVPPDAGLKCDPKDTNMVRRDNLCTGTSRVF